MTTPRGARDFRPAEWAIAIAVAVAVMGGSALAMRAAAIDRHAAPVRVDQEIAVPVKVVPGGDPDLPLLKLGGKRDARKLPDRRAREAPKARAEERALASTKAGKTAQDIPPADVPLADAGAPPPPPDAEITRQVDTPVAAPIDAGPPANVASEGHADGVKEGTETDPLKARAVDLYRARISGWFSSRFRVSGSGLGPEEIVKPRVGAEVEIGADRTVLGYTLIPSGNAAFDAAARAMLDGSRGKALPPPPENYPDIVQRRIRITLVCRPGTCD